MKVQDMINQVKANSQKINDMKEENTMEDKKAMTIEDEVMEQTKNEPKKYEDIILGGEVELEDINGDLGFHSVILKGKKDVPKRSKKDKEKVVGKYDSGKVYIDGIYAGDFFKWNLISFTMKRVEWPEGSGDRGEVGVYLKDEEGNLVPDVNWSSLAAVYYGSLEEAAKAVMIEQNRRAEVQEKTGAYEIEIADGIFFVGHKTNKSYPFATIYANGVKFGYVGKFDESLYPVLGVYKYDDNGNIVVNEKGKEESTKFVMKDTDRKYPNDEYEFFVGKLYQLWGWRMPQTKAMRGTKRDNGKIARTDSANVRSH